MIVSTGLAWPELLLTKTHFSTLLIDSLNRRVRNKTSTDEAGVKGSAIPDFSEEREGWNSYGRARRHGGARAGRAGRGCGGGQVA